MRRHFFSPDCLLTSASFPSETFGDRFADLRTEPGVLAAMASAHAPAGHFSILYFAAAASFAGKGTEHLPAPLRAGDLFAKLDERYPGMAAKVLASCAVTVNLAYVDLDEGEGCDIVIKEGDEVAIIPPVSSG